VLAAVIERASRKSYAEFLKEHIFHPAKMQYTVVYDERKPNIPKPAISYAREGGSEFCRNQRDRIQHQDGRYLSREVNPVRPHTTGGRAK
jgi:CubicO group peptidase (beta-lactamase class C family)